MSIVSQYRFISDISCRKLSAKNINTYKVVCTYIFYARYIILLPCVIDGPKIMGLKIVLVCEGSMETFINCGDEVFYKIRGTVLYECCLYIISIIRTLGRLALQLSYSTILVHIYWFKKKNYLKGIFNFL